MSVQRWGALLMVLTLAACSRTPSEAALTVDYFRTHRVERDSILRDCLNDPGDLRESPVCVNAREAARIEGVGTLKALPPMGLPGVGSGGQNAPGNPPRP